MADTNVPVSEPYGKGSAYNNPGAGYDAAPRHRAHRLRHLLNFILRVLTALASAAAIVVIVKSNQTVSLGGRTLRARWKDFAAFRWFLLANAIICAYSVLAAIASLIGMCIPWGPLSVNPLAWLTFLVDFLLVNALMSAAASATEVAYIGYRGQSSASWAKACPAVGSFCRRVAGALVASYIAWIFLALSTLLAVTAIHNTRRRINS